MYGINTIIFDLDGVLVDACEWHFQALNYALKDLYQYTISEIDHKTIYNGLPTRKKCKILEEQKIISNIDIEAVNSLKQMYTIEIINTQCKINPNKIELFNYLQNKNYKIGCYTNSIRKTALLMLNNSGLEQYFHAIVTNEDIINPKPDPEGYIKIIKDLNSIPIETLIIEDSIPGQQSALQSGANIFVVNNFMEVNLSNLKEII